VLNGGPLLWTHVALVAGVARGGVGPDLGEELEIVVVVVVDLRQGVGKDVDAVGLVDHVERATSAAQACDVEGKVDCQPGR
jgi:hypothetical protein